MFLHSPAVARCNFKVERKSSIHHRCKNDKIFSATTPQHMVQFWIQTTVFQFQGRMCLLRLALQVYLYDRLYIIGMTWKTILRTKFIFCSKLFQVLVLCLVPFNCAYCRYKHWCTPCVKPVVISRTVMTLILLVECIIFQFNIISVLVL